MTGEFILHPSSFILPTALPFPRAARVGPALDRLLETADRAAHVREDPVELVHEFPLPEDREIVGLLASSVAYGRVDLFKPRLRALVTALGPHPSAAARATPAELLERASVFSYRMTGPAEVAALLHAAGRAASTHGSLGALAVCCFEAARDTREALGRFVDAVLEADFEPFLGRRGPTRRLAHLLPSPRLGSACKRLNLFLRWMVRGPDGVDFGQWALPKSALVIPLDTHVHRISLLLGLTRRRDLSWRTAEEITARLRRLDPLDPVKYDFALSHLGISGRCTGRADERRCGGCPLRPVCRLWDGRP